MEAHQPCRLGRHAVRRDQLLLLSESTEESERVRPEADHPDQCHRHERGRSRERDAQPLAPAALAEHQEGQHEPGGQLHADPGRQRHGGRTRMRARLAVPRCAEGTPCAAARGRARGAGTQKQRQREREQQQRVVVRAADGEHQQHGVESDERQRESRGAPEPLGGAHGQPHREQAAQHRDRFQRPDPARDPERGDRVACEREQRAVRRVQVGPADEREDRVGRGVRGDVRVRVEAVQGAHPREREVPEHILGDQRRPEQQDQVGEHDADRERRERQRARAHEHRDIARAHHEHQRLEAPRAELRARAAEGARQPARPAPDVAGDIARRRGRGVDADHRERREQRQQADRAGRAQCRLRYARSHPRRAPRARAVPARRGVLAGRRRSASGVH